MKRYISPWNLDLLEKSVLSILFAAFAYRMLTHYAESGGLITILYFLDQLMVLVFVLARRSTKSISMRPTEWFFAFAGTLFPLLIGPPTPEAALAPAGVCALLFLAGMAIHLWAKLTLRRSFGVVAANRGVKRKGPYRFVRHPMYLGYMITLAAILLSGPNLANVVVVALCCLFFLARIIAEERVLNEDPAYREMKASTTARLIPGVY